MPDVPGRAGADELARLRHRIERDAGQWYPHAPPAKPRIDGRAVSRRDRARLYHFSVSWPSQRHELLAKVTSLAGEPAAAVARPRLGDASDYADKHRYEFRALQRLHERLLEVDDPALVAVRPLAHDDVLRALVMERVPGRSLRDHLTPVSAWVPARRQAVERLLATAGRWLRTFHGLMTPEAPVRRGEAADFRADLAAYLAFLRHRMSVPGSVDRLAALAADVADAQLGNTALVVNHGDCAPRNFLVAGNRVAGIDMLGRWRVPCVEDIGYFLLSLRLLGPRVASARLAYPPGVVERWCAAFLDGYGDGRFPAEMLDAYGVLLLLDRWAALRSRPAVRSGPAAGALARLERRALAGEAHRLLRALA